MNTRRAITSGEPRLDERKPQRASSSHRADELGARIRVARERQQLTQAELAERVGGHTNTISKWERGLSVPSALELLQISRVLREPVDLLLDSRGDFGKVSIHHPPQSKEAPLLDVSLLAETLAAVQKALEMRQIRLPADAFAELVTVVYEQESSQRAKAPGSGDVSGTASRMLRLVKAG